MPDLKAFDEALQKYLRGVRTYPVAVKLLKTEAEIPTGFQRPKRDLGHRITLCQSFAFARRNDLQLAVLKEDMYCPVGLIVLGLVELHPFWLKGSTFLGRYAGTPEAAARMATNVPHFDRGEYVGILTSPLYAANFDVDIVLVYCDAEQSVRLIQAAVFRTGEELESRFTVGPCCATATVKTFRTGKCQLDIPDYGERRYGAIHKDELLFAIPASRLNEIATGLKESHEGGITLPERVALSEVPVRGAYAELNKLLGID